MNTSYKNNSVGIGIFNIAFVLYFIQAFLNTSMYNIFFNNTYLNIIDVICVLLIAMKIIVYDNLSLKTIMVYVISLLILGVVFYNSKDHTPLSAMMFILGSKNIKFDKFLKIYFIIATVLLIIVVISAKMGWIINLTYYRGTTMRQAMGFVYPTNFAAHVFYIILAYVLIRDDRIKNIELIILSMITLQIEILTDARLNVAAIIIMLIIVILKKLFNEKFDLVVLKTKWIFSLWPIIAGGIVSIISILYNSGNTILLKINNLFSNRLYFGHNAYLKYGISLFGQKVDQQGLGGIDGQNGINNTLYMLNYSYIDSSFFRVLMLDGFLFFLVVLLTSFIINKRLYKSKNTLYITFFALVIGCSIVDQHYLEIAFNPFIILCFSDIKNKLC